MICQKYKSNISAISLPNLVGRGSRSHPATSGERRCIFLTWNLDSESFKEKDISLQLYSFELLLFRVYNTRWRIRTPVAKKKTMSYLMTDSKSYVGLTKS